VAAIAVRGLRNLAALLVAMAGVAMLSKISVSGSALGVGLALAARNVLGGLTSSWPTRWPGAVWA